MKKQKISLNRALYNIGMGCQVMDDMADLERDIKTKHHNYVASLIYHDSAVKHGRSETSVFSGENPANRRYPDALQGCEEKAVEKARSYLAAGLSELFEERHRFLVEPAISFYPLK